MSSTLGKKFKITTFGESHGPAVGVVIDGVKPKIKISASEIQHLLDKRKPGKSKVSSQRKEKDKIHILSGIFKGKTTGHPICLVAYNKDIDSKDYEKIKNIFRPGHADFTYFKKYGLRDYRGGGRSSGRTTLSLVAASALAKKTLPNKTRATAYTLQIGNIKAEKINLSQVEKNSVKCPDSKKAKQMEKLILKTKEQKDSVGGIVECIINNPPVGLGDPVFDKLNADLAKAMLSIPAVKGIEFGSGFSPKLGSENNDEFYFSKGIKTKTNNSGGILGGISSGMPIVFRLTVKPTSSIGKKQDTVDINGKKVKLEVKGRHDPCILPRIVPVVESLAYIVLADKYLTQKSIK